MAPQLPIFELGSVLVEVIADDFQRVGKARKENSRGEESGAFHDLDEPVEARGAACGTAQFLRQGLLQFGVETGELYALECPARFDSLLVEIEFVQKV